MLKPHNDGGFETRYEWLRPGQLRARQTECPLVLFPLAPLEYHGPHMPMGTDPINAGCVAHACCKELRRGVVRPTMFLGTERERDPDTLESLGFKRDQYIVGMDFPARQWSSTGNGPASSASSSAPMDSGEGRWPRAISMST